MKVTATLEGEQILNLDVSDDLELENFKALLEFESGVQSSQIVIFHNGVALRDDKKTLNGYGIKDGDVLLMRRRVLNAQPLPPSTGNHRVIYGTKFVGQLDLTLALTSFKLKSVFL